MLLFYHYSWRPNSGDESGGCHAQQIEKKSHPEKKIQRRSNFVGLLKNIFFVNGGTMGWFYAKNAPFLNPKMLTSKGCTKEDQF